MLAKEAIMNINILSIAILLTFSINVIAGSKIDASPHQITFITSKIQTLYYSTSPMNTINDFSTIGSSNPSSRMDYYNPTANGQSDTTQSNIGLHQNVLARTTVSQDSY
jgi:hypothetical protein